MAASPRFSVVIPTRNRAALLRSALASATALTRADCEIVVSDNASTDGTAEVVTALDDPRVRLVRSEVPLSQPDSWEFAVSHATGEWVTILGDDDALVPSALDRVDEVIRGRTTDVVAWREAWYVHADPAPPGSTKEERNALTLDPTTGKVWEVECQAMLPRFFARDEGKPVPGLVNSAISSAALGRFRSRMGRLFPAPDPAVATITAVFALEPAYTAIDQPLGLKGLSGATISIGLFHANRGQHGTIREFDTDDLLRRVPMQSRTGNGLVAESLLAMKEVLADELAPYELDLARYFMTTREEIDDPRRRARRAAALAEWRTALAAQHPEVRREVIRSLTVVRVARVARSAARAVPGVQAWRARSRAEAGFRTVTGSAAGFADLAGAAAWLDAHALAPHTADLSGGNARGAPVTASNGQRRSE